MFADLDANREKEAGKRGRKGKNAVSLHENLDKLSVPELGKRMLLAAENLEFEEAARLRDALHKKQGG